MIVMVCVWLMYSILVSRKCDGMGYGIIAGVVCSNSVFLRVGWFVNGCSRCDDYE